MHTVLAQITPSYDVICKNLPYGGTNSAIPDLFSQICDSITALGGPKIFAVDVYK